MPDDNLKPQFTVDGATFTARPLVSGLHLVATPLGNLGDISFRALSALAAADVILCEDTRVTSRLLGRFSIATRMRPYHDHNASQVRPAILEQLQSGGRVVLVSDAGMPAVSDPGYKLVRDSIALDIPVDVIPGPTAPVTALVLSGLPTDRFMFAGFLPARPGQRRAILTELANVPATLIFFESANRLAASLADMVEELPGRQVAVTRELTKLHQEVLRGMPGEIVEQLQARGSVKGEITIVVGPPDAAPVADEADLEERLAELLKTNSASKAAAQLARETRKTRADLYDLAMKLKGEA